MLHCGDVVLGVMRGVGFAPDIAFSLMAKKHNFSLILPEYLLPYVWGVTHMPLANTKHVFFFLTTVPSSICLGSLPHEESSLVFMVPLACWCPLLRGVADSGAFQNRCICTEIM